MATKTKSVNRLAETPLPVLGNGHSEKTVQDLVTLPKLDFRTVEIHVESLSPLIVHAWSKKAIQMMLDKQMGRASAGREKKNPLKDFQGSLYPVMHDGKQMWGVPAPAFKAAAVSAANTVDLKMTQMRLAFHVASYTVPIFADPLPKGLWTEYDHEYEKELKPYHDQGISMRMDLVRLETGVADIRFRGSWPTWAAKLQVEYNAATISLEQLIMLFDAAGYGCGIAEWRPSAPQCRSGEFGRFRVARRA
jgi:hypothetical protein